MQESAFRTALGEHIFLDRYALKDAEINKNLQVGDRVVYHEIFGIGHGQSRSRIGTVVEKNGEGNGMLLTLSLEGGEYGVEVAGGISVSTIDRLLEKTPYETWERVARAAAEFPKDDDYYPEFYEELSARRFVPGGRILAALGSNTSATASNCFVLGVIEDHRSGPNGIWDRVEALSTIMSRGGGVGYNLSALRPKDAAVRSVNGRSSGAVSWGEIFSKTTGITSQGGSRRGAGMFIMEVWHPDVLEFIQAKKDPRRLNYANVSVGIAGGFMEAVKEDWAWDLRFPDTDSPYYQNEWKGDIEEWERNGRPTVLWKRMKARELWEMICEAAWASAEPGVWFADTARKMSNSYYYQEGRLICTNPCGEQSLPGWAVCNLGHVNLAEFWCEEREGVNWTKLARSVRLAVRFLDNVITLGQYPNEETKKQQELERRIGLGTMGLGEILVRTKLAYGSPESLKFINKLYEFIANEAYEASAMLANERGSFKAFQLGMFLESEFVKRLEGRVQIAIKNY